MGKTIGVYLSDEAAAEIQALAEGRTRGRPSPLIADLIDEYLAHSPGGFPTSEDPHALITLARRMHPTLALPLADLLGNGGTYGRRVDQPRLLAQLLEALYHYLQAGEPSAHPRLEIIDAAALEAPLHAAELRPPQPSKRKTRYGAS